MPHFVAYHSEKRMGYEAEDCEPFSLYTSKKIADIGDIVWIITGKGDSPKQYYLCEWFLVSKLTEADDSEFGISLCGEEGGSFDKMPRLDHLEWFPDFRRRMGNFGIGLTELNPAVIEALRRVAVEAGHPQE
jgi:hypothetical protein